MNRLLISGTSSNCGKTTITMALLAAFKHRGLDISSFKSGPDYIDPMFHRKVFDVENADIKTPLERLGGKGRYCISV